MKYDTSIGIGWHQVPKITTIDISEVLTPIVKMLIPAKYSSWRFLTLPDPTGNISLKILHIQPQLFSLKYDTHPTLECTSERINIQGKREL